MRDGLPRAYLRTDPNLDQHPDPLAMVRAMCAAARQPERGRFRDPRILERAVGRRQYREMVQRGDVVPADPGPGIYLDGWDEWQEGDFTVAERMRRMRARRAAKRRAAVAPVTVPPSRGRTDVTTDAVDTSVEEGASASGVGVDPPNPPPAGGRSSRANGTNPRALAQRALQAQAEEREKRRKAKAKIHQRYLRGEIDEAEERRLYAELDGPGDEFGSLEATA